MFLKSRIAHYLNVSKKLLPLLAISSSLTSATIILSCTFFLGSLGLNYEFSYHLDRAQYPTRATTHSKVKIVKFNQLSVKYNKFSYVN